jgi:hypothetical protein
VRIEQRLREQEHVVAAEVPVRFLTGYQEKVAIRKIRSQPWK